jgi:hypothetical protein
MGFCGGMIMDKILELLAKANALLVLEINDLRDRLESKPVDTGPQESVEVKQLRDRIKQLELENTMLRDALVPVPIVSPPYVAPTPWIEQSDIVAYGCPMERHEIT